jgi:hypothetical protein
MSSARRQLLLPVVLPRFRMLPDCLIEFVPVEKRTFGNRAGARGTIVSSFGLRSAWTSHVESSTGR